MISLELWGAGQSPAVFICTAMYKETLILSKGNLGADFLTVILSVCAEKLIFYVDFRVCRYEHLYQTHKIRAIFQSLRLVSGSDFFISF